MADKIIKGYWDCPQCGTKGIDGLLDACPNCGSGKDKNVRYYMKDTNAVSEEEREIMADFAATINQAYFAGDWDSIHALKDSRGWNLWRTKALGSFWYTYIWSIFEEY